PKATPKPAPKSTTKPGYTAPPKHTGATVSNATGTAGGHGYVNLGLPSGTLWAMTNVGAKSPEGLGNYYAWGETSPKDYYDWDNYKYCQGSDDTMTKYCTTRERGKVDNKRSLEANDDAATVNWGEGWRLPSSAQFDELREICTWTWTAMNGRNGYKIVGPNGNSIFLPAAGARNESGTTTDLNEYGFYRTRTLDTVYSNGDRAANLIICEDKPYKSESTRDAGQTVRPIYEQ
ncbi:MAG: hypothetical protein Q4D23_09460, partial [Bacteroidales bacterium]|nr:hypothetical protein [Bacteroidales bacterium]